MASVGVRIVRVMYSVGDRNGDPDVETYRYERCFG